MFGEIQCNGRTTHQLTQVDICGSRSNSLRQTGKCSGDAVLEIGHGEKWLLLNVEVFGQIVDVPIKFK